MSKPMKFTVTEDHIKLLKRMYIDWDDSGYDGVPAPNLKRPYGNSDVMGDVAEVLELDWDEDEDDDMPDELMIRCETIHREMEFVLQILVQNPEGIEPGEYVNVSRFAPYGTEYRRADA